MQPFIITKLNGMNKKMLLCENANNLSNKKLNCVPEPPRMFTYAGFLFRHFYWNNI